MKLRGKCAGSVRMKASLQYVRELGGTAGDCLLPLQDELDPFLDLRNEDQRQNDACDL